MIDNEKIKCMVIRALEKFYLQDEKLIDFGVNETTISARIAMYLYELVEKEKKAEKIYVDCEYNKYRENQRKPAPASYPHKSIRPDIIIHSRGNDDNNLLYCEVKKNKVSQNDIAKINHVLKKLCYHMGLSIHNISSKSVTLRWVKQGEQAGRKKLDIKYIWNKKKKELEQSKNGQL